MTTVLFVHGVSVRQRNHPSVQTIESYLKQRRPELALATCIWGEQFGAALKAGGASIPHGSVAKGLDDELILSEEIGSWQALYSDPLCELRLWALRLTQTAAFDPLGRKTPIELLDERLQSISFSSAFGATLHSAGFREEEFHSARQSLVRSPVYSEASQTTLPEDLDEFVECVARTIVAIMILQRRSPHETITTIDDRVDFPSADMRDNLIANLTNELGNPSKGLMNGSMARAVSTLGTRYFKASREFFCSAIVPYIGDILLYQGAGKPIRDLIRARILQCEPPVVVLAHSLGGVACVELLAGEVLDQVELLVTVGSQAPFFYELDALSSLRFGQQLPPHFPRWLNIYDRCDFLSFIGGSVFRQGNDVEDIEVQNRQPFPWSHVSYWTNTQTWDAILSRLPSEQR